MLRRFLGPWFFLLLFVCLACVRLRNDVVRVPVSSWPNDEVFRLATINRLAAKRDLNLEITRYRDRQLIVSDFAWGRLRLAMLTTVELVDVCARVPERCPVVVMVLNESRGGHQLVAAPAIRSVRDLRARPVGVISTSLGPYLVARALQKEGLRLQDVVLRIQSLESMLEAMNRGQLAAAAMYPPFSDRLLQSGSARLLFDSNQIQGEIFDVLVVEPAYLRRHGEEVARLIRVWQDARDFARSRPELAARQLAAREGWTLAEWRKLQRVLPSSSLPQQLSMLAPGGVVARNLREVRDRQAELGLLPKQSKLPQVSDQPLRQALRLP
jgi:NitT/TauT family transport system substrate-binding protein